ncbi:MAG: hypothetical protein A2298_03465 [Gammaproteobacteria bacterium RIFOXYB2_FULL_38_6]|nr:MAG: hypothetical protein A2298_03465 [Gammaproteobacteria bacterium RIFOXYB2_FULL_38_6]
MDTGFINLIFEIPFFGGSSAEPLAELMDIQKQIDILRYWHKIEFFIPFDLSQITYNCKKILVFHKKISKNTGTKNHLLTLSNGS